MPYVAVLECQKRGAIHPHLAVHGFQDIRLLRRCWYKIVGNAQGQVNVKGPRPGSSPVKLARYLSKYISKDIDNQPREFEEHRYFCSLGIAVPTERFQMVLTSQREKSRIETFLSYVQRHAPSGWRILYASSTGLEEQGRLDGYLDTRRSLAHGRTTQWNRKNSVSLLVHLSSQEKQAFSTIYLYLQIPFFPTELKIMPLFLPTKQES